MTKNKIHINHDAVAKIQEQHDNAFRQILRDVNADMAGQPADAVHAEIVKRATATFGDFTPGPQLREFAQSISDGTLTD